MGGFHALHSPLTSKCKTLIGNPDATGCCHQS